MIRTVVLAAIFAFSGVAFAQSGGTTAPFEKPAGATPDEMRAFVAEASKQVQEGSQKVAKLTETAKKEGDAAALQCLTEKTMALQALVQVVAGASQKMNTALDAGDANLAGFEYSKVAIAKARVDNIVMEANACLGVEGERGNNVIDVTGDEINDQDTVDNDEIDDMDIGSDSPSISSFEDEQQN